MSAASDAQTDFTAGLDAKIQPNTPWRIVSVTPLAGYRLKVRFVDGLEGEVHLDKLLTSSNAGVFAPLRDERLFAKVDLRWGAVTWPGGLDLAPDAMYDDVRSRGVCIVLPHSD